MRRRRRIRRGRNSLIEKCLIIININILFFINVRNVSCGMDIYKKNYIY